MKNCPMCKKNLINEDKTVCKTCLARRRNLRHGLKWINKLMDGLTGIELYTMEKEDEEKDDDEDDVVIAS